MSTVKDIYNFIDAFAPFASAESYDNVGLIVGDFNRTVDTVVVALDASAFVTRYAKECGAQLIVCHHPPLFRPIDALTVNSESARLIDIVKSDLSVIAAHTNLDRAVDGVTDNFASVLKLRDAQPIFDGFGRIGNVAKCSLSAFSKEVARVLNDDCVRVVGSERDVTRVAAINGAGGGSDGILSAIEAGADVLVTSETKHNAAIYALEHSLAIIDVTHYHAERIYMERLRQKLQDEYKKLKVILADESSPFQPRGGIS